MCGCYPAEVSACKVDPKDVRIHFNIQQTENGWVISTYSGQPRQWVAKSNLEVADILFEQMKINDAAQV